MRKKSARRESNKNANSALAKLLGAEKLKVEHRCEPGKMRPGKGIASERCAPPNEANKHAN